MTPSYRSLAILVPVLGRPHRVAPLLDSIQSATPAAHVVFLSDPDDAEENDAVVAETPYRRLVVSLAPCGGNYAQKINHGVRITDEPLLLFGADDLRFHRGWYGIARGATANHGVVSTNDWCQPRVASGELATHPLVKRSYAELETWDGSPGPLCELYPHEYVDREFSEVAQMRGEFTYAPLAIVEHLHPMVGKAPMDKLYSRMRPRMRAGSKIYRRRRSRWTRQS